MSTPIGTARWAAVAASLVSGLAWTFLAVWPEAMAGGEVLGISTARLLPLPAAGAALFSLGTAALAAGYARRMALVDRHGAGALAHPPLLSMTIAAGAFVGGLGGFALSGVGIGGKVCPGVPPAGMTVILQTALGAVVGLAAAAAARFRQRPLDVASRGMGVLAGLGVPALGGVLGGIVAQLSWVVLDQILPADPCPLPETSMFATGVVCGVISRTLLLSAALAPSDRDRSATLQP